MDIENFWKDAPDVVLDVEKSWNEFVESINGKRVDSYLSKSPVFNNADYIFLGDQVIIELKEIKTEFSRQPAFYEKLTLLVEQLAKEDENWRPSLLGGDGAYPAWFIDEFVRIFRPPMSRILKKANKQIKETKDHFDINNQKGTVIIVNDYFTSLDPKFVIKIIVDLLIHSYKSIDCMIYLTVNRYVRIEGDNEPKLIWVPIYSDRADENLHFFINDLGRKWYDYLETKIGFTSRRETESGDYLLSAKALLLPHEN